MGKEQETLTNLDRVDWIYSNYPDAVESDYVLLAIYSNYFGTPKNKEDTIKRLGRLLRQKYPDQFHRSVQKQVKDREVQESLINVFHNFNIQTARVI